MFCRTPELTLFSERLSMNLLPRFFFRAWKPKREGVVQTKQPLIHQAANDVILAGDRPVFRRHDSPTVW